MTLQEQLKSKLTYNKDTGQFMKMGYKYSDGEKILSSGVLRTVGTKNKNGVVMISFNGRLISSARLAFLYVLGYLPNKISYRDNDRSNSRWNNIEAEDFEEPEEEIDYPEDFEGAVYDDFSQLYSARIMLGGEPVYKGKYHSFGEAKKAYSELKRELKRMNSLR